MEYGRTIQPNIHRKNKSTKKPIYKPKQDFEYVYGQIKESKNTSTIAILH